MSLEIRSKSPVGLTVTFHEADQTIEFNGRIDKEAICDLKLGALDKALLDQPILHDNPMWAADILLTFEMLFRRFAEQSVGKAVVVKKD